MSDDKADGKKKQPRRIGHRGYMMDNAAIDQNITIFPGGFNIDKMKEKGYPLKFYWPRYGDFEGAKGLIEAVMEKNLAEIESYRAQFPEYNLGLDDYIAVLRKEYVGSTTLEIVKLKSTEYNHGITVDYSLERDSVMKKQFIVATIRRSAKVIKRKILAEKAYHGKTR